MYESYIKETKLLEKTEEEMEIELIESILKTKADLDLANKNFEYAEAELIDYYSYQIKANQSKLDYLIKKVKQNGIIMDYIKHKNIILYNQNEVI